MHRPKTNSAPYIEVIRWYAQQCAELHSTNENKKSIAEAIPKKVKSLRYIPELYFLDRQRFQVLFLEPWPSTAMKGFNARCHETFENVLIEKWKLANPIASLGFKGSPAFSIVEAARRWLSSMPLGAQFWPPWVSFHISSKTYNKFA
jgi:hypothetical protein